MGTKPQPGKIATFGVRFETHDHFLVEYTDHLRGGFLVLPGVKTLSKGQPVRIKLSLPNRGVLYLTGLSLGPDHPDAEGKGTLVRLSALTDEQKRVMELCVSAVIGTADTAPTTSSKPIEVLLVEDSDNIRAELTQALTKRGLKVRVAENGLVAISSALKAEPDVILTDVEMPVMDGWTLLRMARSRKRLSHLPIVFLTSLSDEMSRLQGYRMGVDDYLPKKLPPDEIVARLQGVLRRQRKAGGDEAKVASAASGLRGDLRHVGLGSVLSFLEAEKKTGDLRVENGTDHAVLRIVHGFLRDVKPLGTCSEHQDRVFELLGWKGGQFEFVSLPEGQEVDHGPLKPTPMTYLLMEFARREDEASAGRGG
jgi:DNA-binding response OmpR family regulator